jgi:hypothetical protein
MRKIVSQNHRSGKRPRGMVTKDFFWSLHYSELQIKMTQIKGFPFLLQWLRVATFISTCLHNLTSHLTHLDPEDGGNMFLQNVGIQLQNYTVLQSRG